MSNPMANLRRSKRVPFAALGRSGSPPGKNVPYRSYTTSEEQMLNEITGKMATDRLKDPSDKLPWLRDEGSKNSSPRSNASGGSDQELMSLMMTRLGQLEQKLQYRTKELSEKDKKVRILEDKIRILQKTKDESRPGRMVELEKKCLLLQQQVHEMETFLADYGMIWCGQTTDPESDVYIRDDKVSDGTAASDDDDTLTKSQIQNTLWHPTDSLPAEFSVDYDCVIENVAELNALAGEGIGRVQHTSDGARLKMPDHVPLTLYANGLLMFSGPFRPFTEPTTQTCVRDLMDGYFPSELQDRYPDGVPFQLSDKRSVHFEDRLSRVFEGHAQPLGGDTKPSRLVPTNLDKHRTRTDTKATQARDTSPRETTSQIPGRQVTMEQFLGKLPPSVIKAGKVIDIRTAVGGQLKGSDGPAGVTVVETEAVREMTNQLEKRHSANTRDLTTLRIKNEKGDHTYVLKMRYGETIGDVHVYLNRLRPRGSPSYSLMSTFPRQSYTDHSQTLEAASLIPNATLHLQPHKPTK